MAQRKDPIKGDWYSIILEIMQEFDFGGNEEVIRYIPLKMFKKIVKQKGKIAGVKYLLAQQKKCEKGSRIKYENLELQDYLQPSSNLKLEDQQFLFSLR